ncbi:hypothetical protein OBBRIDRAFT_314359 [Obba rivulosa]|uniref:Uncharacterized protein n=1 Tax=Obba rivulosa TaxID=1052685 RepID=A0A8E2ANT8_9APHY|nr:hypothetical protein OBBRIDRAFT_314359 [Obba rivulosa]
MSNSANPTSQPSSTPGQASAINDQASPCESSRGVNTQAAQIRQRTYFYYGYCSCASHVRDVAVQTLKLHPESLAPDAEYTLLRFLRYRCNLDRYPWQLEPAVYDAGEEAITVLVLLSPRVGTSPPPQCPVIDRKLKDFCEPRFGPARWWTRSYTTHPQGKIDEPLSEIVPEEYHMSD